MLPNGNSPVVLGLKLEYSKEQTQVSKNFVEK